MRQIRFYLVQWIDVTAYFLDSVYSWKFGARRKLGSPTPIYLETREIPKRPKSLCTKLWRGMFGPSQSRWCYSLPESNNLALVVARVWVWPLWQETSERLHSPRAGTKKCSYHRRKVVWEKIAELIRAGWTAQTAIDESMQLTAQMRVSLQPASWRPPRLTSLDT